MRLVIVSNRLPIGLERDDPGWSVRPVSGGLVTALRPVMRQMGGLWIGWPGAAGVDPSEISSLLLEFEAQNGFSLKAVAMSKSDVEGFYQGFSNEIIWPLFHDLQSRCNFDPGYWTRSIAIRHAFADVVLESVHPDDFIWIHDYHLMGMALRLRERGVQNRIGFFLHIPFPPPDIFRKLPWRNDVLEGLLCHDIIGFQTPRDVQNFIDCTGAIVPAGKPRNREGLVECYFKGRRCRVGAFPVGIDYQQFAEAAQSDEVTARVLALKELIPRQQIVLGVDRLDYTKGILYRLRALQLALRRYPEIRRMLTLVQVIVPSRENVPEYQELKSQMEQLVTQINGEFTEPGWVPVHHFFRSLEWQELVAHYRAADVGWVTPLKDGMNLVAKEYCACQVEGDAVLILSEFAGAAVQFGGNALLVNPYDLDQGAESIRRAITMTHAERKPAMRRLRSIVRRQDVYWWAGRFLRASGLSIQRDKESGLLSVSIESHSPGRRKRRRPKSRRTVDSGA